MYGGLVIYLIGCEGTPFFKVGRAVDPGKRLRTLQVGCPLKLHIVRCWAEESSGHEAMAHARLWRFRHRGEWFDFKTDDDRFVSRLVDLAVEGTAYEAGMLAAR